MTTLNDFIISLDNNNDTERDIDAILVLGGGVPSAYNRPPIFVQSRCAAAAGIYNHWKNKTSNANNVKILCLSAGTAHLPQALNPEGLPIWESTASAAYLVEECHIPVEDIYVETTSYDTISNAYFARTQFVDVAGWRNLVVITSEFHMSRSRTIFDWIFGLNNNLNGNNHYNLMYVTTDNDGLSKDAVGKRKEHEAKSEINVREKLCKSYQTLLSVWGFLTSKHDFYTASGLIKNAKGEGRERPASLKESYGRGSGL